MTDNEDTLLNSLTEAAAQDAAAEAPEAEVKKEEAVEEDKPDDQEAEKEVSEDVDPDADADDEPTDAPAKKHRASDTIRALKEERKADRLEKEKLIAERATYAAQLEHLRQQKHAEQSAADRKAEEERLSLLDPTERAAYQANQKAASLEHRLNIMQMQMQDNTDRAVFQSRAAHDPLIAKYKDQVEQMLEDDKRKGFSAPRDTYLQILVGKAVIENSAKDLSKKKASASKRIDSATSKPASARGDVAGSKQGKSEEDRLRGVLI